MKDVERQREADREYVDKLRENERKLLEDEKRRNQERLRVY